MNYFLIIKYIPQQIRTTPITYSRLIGSFNKMIPARLTNNTPPSRIAGTATDTGAFAPKVVYNPNVTPLNEMPTPIAAKKPDI